MSKKIGDVMKLKKKILIQIKTMIKVVLIGSLFSCLIAVILFVAAINEEKLTEDNTTEYTATVAAIGQWEGDIATASTISTIEYGQLFIRDPGRINDIDAFHNLIPGQAIHFRVISSESTDSINFIVSLKTGDKEIMTLSSYNDLLVKRHHTMVMVGTVICIISLSAFIICKLLLTKIKKLNRLKTDKSRTGESSSLNITEAHENIMEKVNMNTTDTIFENHLICTEEFYREFKRYFYLKSPKMMLLNTILITVLIVSFIIDSLWKQEIISVNLSMIAIVIVGVYFYGLFAKKSPEYEQSLELNQGKPSEVILAITDNNIILWSNNSSNTNNVALTEIEKAVQTKNYYILIKRTKSTIVLKKDSFMKGTAIQFEGFLQQKGLAV